MRGMASVATPVVIVAAAAASGLAGTISALVLIGPLWAVIGASWSFLLIVAALSVWAGHWAYNEHLPAALSGGLVGAIFGAFDNLKRVLTAAQRAHWVAAITHQPVVPTIPGPSLLHFPPGVNFVIAVMIFAWVAAFVSVAAAGYFGRAAHRAQ